MNNRQDPVLVVGGGWAGLSAAVHLAHQGVPVRLVEAARQLGGRARRVRLGDFAVDNGQHLLIGAYRQTLALFRQLGLDTDKALLRMPLHLESWRGKQRLLRLSAPRLPEPFHVLVALLTARGPGIRDRLRALAFGLFLQRRRGQLEQESSVAELLQQRHQTANTITLLWEPLCLATLNTPIAKASARVFVRVLYDALFRCQGDSDLIFARRDLGALLPDPAMQFIENHGGTVQLGKRVTGLRINGTHLQAVDIDQEPLAVSQVILAVSPEQCLALCAGHAALAPLHDQLTKLDYQPICTVYLQYPPDIHLEQPAIGMLGGLCQWLFDRGRGDQAGMMAAVISAEGPHMAMDNAGLIAAVTAEIARVKPHWPAPLEARVIREKRATFACRPQIDHARPASTTPVAGLYLAGDYTATGYPATLEGAVLSGKLAAQQLVKTLQEEMP